MQLPILSSAALLLLGACAAPGGSPAAPADASLSGAAGPGAVLDAVRSAEAARRYADVLALLPPEDRLPTVFMTWFGAAYTAIGGGAKADDYAALRARYGLDDAYLSQDMTAPRAIRGVAAEALAGIDVPALYQDLIAFEVAHGRFGSAFSMDEPTRNLVLDGDTATAQVGSRQVLLVRLDGRWYWRMLTFD